MPIRKKTAPPSGWILFEKYCEVCGKVHSWSYDRCRICGGSLAVRKKQ